MQYVCWPQSGILYKVGSKRHTKIAFTPKMVHGSMRHEKHITQHVGSHVTLNKVIHTAAAVAVAVIVVIFCFSTNNYTNNKRSRQSIVINWCFLFVGLSSDRTIKLQFASWWLKTLMNLARSRVQKSFSTLIEFHQQGLLISLLHWLYHIYWHTRLWILPWQIYIE